MKLMTMWKSLLLLSYRLLSGVFLAQKELLKLKYVVKLQAAVRGHLVRQHAIGTLRCVQAIVKMQALIRARRARSWEEQVVGKHGNPLSETPQKECSVIKPTTTYISIEKLLRNSFARQLMKSTPKRKPIRIKCDSSKPNSGWNWLERWMSVSSPEPTPSPDLITEQLEIEKSEIVTSPVQTRAPPERFCELENSKPNVEEIVLSTESEKNNVISDVPDFKFQVCHPNSPLAGDQLERLPQPEMISKSDTEETPITIISPPNQTVESEVNSKTVTDSLPCKQELEGEQPDLPRRSLKRGASEQLDTEEKKFVYGSRKSSSPVLIASQAKFEELSSKASLNRSSSFSHQDSGIESNSDISGIDTELRTKELDMTENSVSHISRVQYGSSECGTELSVTSTLDSPDAFEVGAAELEHGAKVSEEETRNPNRTKFLDIEDEDSSKDPVSNLSHVKEPEKLEVIKGESANTIVAADSTREEMNPEISVSDVKRELSSETGGLAYRSSPEASPRSHLTVPWLPRNTFKSVICES
ncbi:hypothetical protein OIU84_005173 [Salix udensis]|uniref:DUF4005 domain-containing protein n=1 Tax=Salix udensis TaxID=889485 RepID=A0AAD6P0Q2_9ROSI|nr:hypothetical protein OIU84_005173 [Salix udensis]